MTSVIYFVVLIAVTCAAVVRTHPTYYRQFTDHVKRNNCLANCMQPVTDYGEELSIIKNTNLGYYFEQHDQICGIINTARMCIDGCGIQSNPFAMEHMVGYCTPVAIQLVRHVHKCFKTTKSQINNECEQSCGNYKAVNDAAHSLTLKLASSKTNYTSKEVEPIIEHLSNACVIYTCMARCNVASVQNYCNVGEANSLQELLQYILDAHRRDLERHGVLEHFANQTPVSCSYMYQPNILFNDMSFANKHQQNPVHELYQGFASIDGIKQIPVKQLAVLEPQEKATYKGHL